MKGVVTLIHWLCPRAERERERGGGGGKEGEGSKNSKEGDGLPAEFWLLVS